LLVAGVVLHNGVGTLMMPFSVMFPFVFVMTNGGVPVKVSEFVVMFALVPYALAHSGWSGLAYVPYGSVDIILYQDMLLSDRTEQDCKI